MFTSVVILEGVLPLMELSDSGFSVGVGKILRDVILNKVLSTTID